MFTRAVSDTLFEREEEADFLYRKKEEGQVSDLLPLSPYSPGPNPAHDREGRWRLAQGFRIPNGSNWPLFRSYGPTFWLVVIVLRLNPARTQK